MNFIQVNISREMILLRMLFSVTLTSICKVKHVKCKYWEMVRAVAKMRHVIFTGVDIRYRMASPCMLYSAIWTIICNVKYFYLFCYEFVIKCATADVPGRFVLMPAAPTVVALIL